VVRAEIDIKKIRKALMPVFKNAGAKKVVLFGSFSRGSQTKRSDLDLMIITETDKRFFERYEQFDRIHDIINDRAVDMLIYTADELSRISHRPFIKQILSEGETIYES
jgi:predicted nucleotidyltransferase